jgi:enoyl-CoA hydratase/carnithine racemase
MSTLDIDVGARGAVRIVEIRRPPHNYFDQDLVEGLVHFLEEADADPSCRALVLCAEGSSFCAGADLSKDMSPSSKSETHPLYLAALRIFACRKPIVAAVHGSAVGGGLGLALACDFRVTCREARFSANFARLGVHAGFGLSVTLPRLVGVQSAALMLYTGRRIHGAEAVERGLADILVEKQDVREQAYSLAAEIAESSPIAVLSMRATLRQDLLPALTAAMAHESSEQYGHFRSEDIREGVAAMAQRRKPNFLGR